MKRAYSPKAKPGLPPMPRLNVARCLRAVAEGQSLSVALPRALEALDEHGRSFVQALVYASLRRAGSTRFLLKQLLAKPLTVGAERIEPLLLAALTELRDFATPPYATVDAAVESVRALGLNGAAGLVNAVLRRFLRERVALEALLAADLQASSEHPGWFFNALRKHYPQHWTQIVRANLQQAPMWLRVHPRSGDAQAYAGKLTQESSPVPGLPQALKLSIAVDALDLPGFAAGSCSVQDLAAQHCALLLAPQRGERVLDACAAPGGKTAHLLELGAAPVLALDVDPGRLARIQATLERLQVHAEVRCADVGEPAQWFNGVPFDAILLDAPCSATGVVRRHPDILSLRRGADIAALARTQRRLLNAVWPLLKAGGRLLYATCSVLPEENERVIGAFLADHSDARERPWNALTPECFSEIRSHGRLNLPGAGGADGFYLALLEKG